MEATMSAGPVPASNQNNRGKKRYSTDAAAAEIHLC